MDIDHFKWRPLAPSSNNEPVYALVRSYALTASLAKGSAQSPVDLVESPLRSFVLQDLAFPEHPGRTGPLAPDGRFASCEAKLLYRDCSLTVCSLGVVWECKMPQGHTGRDEAGSQLG